MARAQEVIEQSRNSWISWRSVIAGLFITFLIMTIIGSLGMAIGGIGLYDGTTLQSASVYTGIWFIVTMAISLLGGSYFAGRASRSSIRAVGVAHGLVVAAVFFAVMIYQAASTVGWIGRNAGSALAGSVSAAAQGVAQASQNPTVNAVVEDVLGDLNIPPERIQAVVTGTATRLLAGNTDSARNFLARQTGIKQDEAAQRIATARTQVEQAAVSTRQGTAQTLQATGWTLLALLVVGCAASILGGALGAHFQIRPELDGESIGIRSQTPSYV